MSGVRNLRAMFEQKGDSSPPERGRSPGVTSNSTEFPRPLSRVHTSFIAIEKDGRIGLQRDASRDSNVTASTRKTSGELEGISPPAAAQKSFVPAENTPTRSNFKEIPRSDTGFQSTGLSATKLIAKDEAPLPTTPRKPNVDEPQTKKLGPDATTEKVAATGGGAELRNGGHSDTLNGASGGGGKGKGLSKESSITAAGGTPKAATRTVPIMTAKTTTAKPAKSPTVAKAPKSPATAAPKLSSKTPDRKATHPDKTATPRAATSATKPTGVSSVQKPPPLKPSPSSTGFIKPKVKSPTRPVKLPPGLTTHTAASGSKVNNPRQSLSRASGVYSASDPQNRSPSRVSVSTVGTTKTSGTASKSLKRQNSTINRPRPSLGPPPKPLAKDHPPTKREKDVDEGFLARMMRPTQASSSKTADKVPVTPPRKTPAATTVKKIVPKQAVKAARRPVTKTTTASASNSSEEAQFSARVVVHPAKPSSEQAVAPVTETPAPAQEWTSTTKEVDVPALSTDEAGQDTTPQKIAPASEKLEAPQDVAGAAKPAEAENSSQRGEKIDNEKEETTSKVVEEPQRESATSPNPAEPEPAQALEPDAGELEPPEVPMVNGNHEKPVSLQEDHQPPTEPTPASVDESEAKEAVGAEEESTA